MASSTPDVSSRIDSTDSPIVVLTKQLISSSGRKDVLSLAQGIVHWSPPPKALAALASSITDPSSHQYGPVQGLPELCQGLRDKLSRENGLSSRDYDVMVTAGANQAFINIVIALVDASHPVVLFAPLYFNHRMALQMTGGADRIIEGPCNPTTLHPDIDWLATQLSHPDASQRPRMVVVTNPCNPTGVLLSRAELDRIASLCREAGTWLVLDNTYEHFVYDGGVHYAPSGPHIIQIFSFSKGYGMMGWRVGYIAVPTPNGEQHVMQALVKAQDTIPICVATTSQRLALLALQHGGSDYVRGKVDTLQSNRDVVRRALAPLGDENVFGGEGAIYYWCKLPPGCDGEGSDTKVVAWLIREHGVCTIPGSSCGVPGCIRVAYANLAPEACVQAAERLERGLRQLVQEGMQAVLTSS